MLEMIQNNAGTLAVGLVVLAAMGMAARTLVRDKQQGKSSCGCGCKNCPSAGACHAAKR